MSLPGVRQEPPRNAYEVIIVGAGVQGLALAYELCKGGLTDVLVLDRSWPGRGASGRNGELIRSGFSSPEWCELFELARQRWLGLSQELDFNVLFNRTGYAVLASTEQQWENCVRDHAFQAGLGIKTELLDHDEMRRAMPAVNPDLVRGGIIQQAAGFAHHDSVVEAYLASAARMGAHVCSGYDVVAVPTQNDRVAGVTLSDGRTISAPIVVNAAGGAAPELNDLLGVDAGIVAARLEMIVTQPLKPFLKQGLAALELLGYCHQTARGEFVGGTERHGVDRTSTLNGSWEMLRDMATKFTRLFPALHGARLLRHWAGTVSQTQDLAPVLGPVPQVEGYLLTVGWVYGFMGAPGSAELLADHIMTGRTDPRMAPFSIERIAAGRWIKEGSLVVDADY